MAIVKENGFTGFKCFLLLSFGRSAKKKNIGTPEHIFSCSFAPSYYKLYFPYYNLQVCASIMLGGQTQGGKSPYRPENWIDCLSGGIDNQAGSGKTMAGDPLKIMEPGRRVELATS
jgi:hypothetical protein